jgi:hypothetical protein
LVIVSNVTCGFVPKTYPFHHRRLSAPSIAVKRNV